ncbi:hypothetical protein GOP47_0010254 [Adiantum capillus-veneris]|uniref:Uncharacterized protein n=1 Tax=Adiantum capillus-veneris TaxID=13818 RepID=A0A9D4UUE0_ADICA|nr:hypothetical protein GOP47_0010254 [Adiantum capillus-veneris]
MGEEGNLTQPIAAAQTAITTEQFNLWKQRKDAEAAAKCAERCRCGGLLNGRSLLDRRQIDMFLWCLTMLIDLKRYNYVLRSGLKHDLQEGCHCMVVWNLYRYRGYLVSRKGFFAIADSASNSARPAASLCVVLINFFFERAEIAKCKCSSIRRLSSRRDYCKCWTL